MGKEGNHAGCLCHCSSIFWLIFDMPRRMGSATSANGAILPHILGAWARSTKTTPAVTAPPCRHDLFRDAGPRK